MRSILRNRVFRYAPAMGADAATMGKGTPARARGAHLEVLKDAIQVAEVAAYGGGSLRQFRGLRLSGILLAVSGVASVLLARQLGASDVADVVALRVVAYACWLYGALGLWALLGREALKNSGGALLKMRGKALLPYRSQAVGIARHLFVGMCLSGMPGVLAAAIVSPNIPSLLQRFGLLILSPLYLLSLAIVLGVLGAFSAHTSPKSPRRAALLMILVPFLLSLFINDVPSIPGFYSWLLRNMIDWGGAYS